MDYLEALEHHIPNHMACRVTMPSNTTCRQKVALLCVMCLKSITLIIQEGGLMGVNGYLRKEGRERCSGGEFELADLLAKQCSLLGKKWTKEAVLGNCSALKNSRRQIVRCLCGKLGHWNCQQWVVVMLEAPSPFFWNKTGENQKILLSCRMLKLNWHCCKTSLFPSSSPLPWCKEQSPTWGTLRCQMGGTWMLQPSMSGQAWWGAAHVQGRQGGQEGPGHQKPLCSMCESSTLCWVLHRLFEEGNGYVLPQEIWLCKRNKCVLGNWIDKQGPTAPGVMRRELMAEVGLPGEETRLFL